VRVVTDSGRPWLMEITQPNIIVDGSGNPRIADFGLATIARDSNSLVSTSDDPSYTLRWAAPEILGSGKAASKASDIFSFGMVMIEVGVINLLRVNHLICW